MLNLRITSSVLAAALLIVCTPSGGGVEPQRPSSISIAPVGEPGERLLVRGRVVSSEGGKPVAGARVYAYHTDARGLYSPGNDNSNPRLHGTMWTDSAGRYEFRTIRPASYPGTRNPAHIHFEVAAAGFADRKFEIVFEDDPLVDDRIRSQAAVPGAYVVIRPLARAAGGLECDNDIPIQPAGR